MFHLLIVVTYLASLTQAAPQTYGVPKLDGKIVGGESTTIEEYPYQAALEYFSSFTCGAVVISEDYVLTAAHCTEGVSTRYSVRAGSSFRNGGGVVIDVAAIYQNPNYWGIDYDISILRLASPLSFGPTIAPITLPKFNQPVTAGSISKVSGWGLLTEGGSVAPTQLQVVEVPIISLEECRAAYGANGITSRMVCAGYPEGGKDACQGDSGGPLVVNGTLIGLVSYGRGCARPNFPGVYASVPELRDFITEITGF